MKNLIILIALLFCLSACKKYNKLKDEDLSKDPSYLYGRLFLTDTVKQSVRSQGLAGKTVTISYDDSADRLNYLLSTTTDKEGYFKFSPLAPGKKYRISYSETIDGTLYTADSSAIELPNDKLALNAGISMTGQNGIIFTVSDSLGNRLKGADVCIFSSPIPYNNTTCDGSSYSLKSDINGHASQFGIQSGTYYFLSKITVKGAEYIQKGSFQVSNKVEKQSLKLKLPDTSPSNLLEIIFVDQFGSAVPNGKVCLFTSKVLFARDTCENSNYSVLTNVSGKVSIPNMIPGKYYVLGDVSLKNVKLLAKDSITVSNNKLTLTLRLK
jgi:hypothetical protein